MWIRIDKFVLRNDATGSAAYFYPADHDGDLPSLRICELDGDAYLKLTGTLAEQWWAIHAGTAWDARETREGEPR